MQDITLVTGKALGSPEKGNVDKMSEKCRKNVGKLSGGAENTIFRHFLDNFCLFGRCFCLVTLSNARPLQYYMFNPGFTPERSTCFVVISELGQMKPSDP